jgi:hypothetical protein
MNFTAEYVEKLEKAVIDLTSGAKVGDPGLEVTFLDEVKKNYESRKQPKLKMEKVNSSNIEEIGYDESISALVVTFKNTSSYRYIGVPKDVYESLMKAESIGTFFSKFVRNQFQCLRIA